MRASGFARQPVVRWLALTGLVAAPPVAGTEVAVAAGNGTEAFPEPGDQVVLSAASAAGIGAEQAAMIALRSRFRVTAAGLHMYNRVEMHRGSWRGMLLSERDPGEPNPVDFVAFYVERRGDRSRFVAGDLRPGFAQGLIYGRSTRRSRFLFLSDDSGHLGYRATAENAALRGLAWQRRLTAGTLTLVLGRFNRDGRHEAGRVIALPGGGRHVSATERSGRKTVGGWNGGLRVRWSRGIAAAGIVLATTRLEDLVDLRKAGRAPWAFHGTTRWSAAADLVIDGRSGRLVAELAQAGDGRRAAVATGRLRLGRLRLRAQMRYLDPGWLSFFGAGPATGTSGNERGYALALSGSGMGVWWESVLDQRMSLQPGRDRPVPAPAERMQLAGRGRLAGGRWAMAVEQRRGRSWSGGGEVGERSRKLRLSHIRGRAPAGEWTVEAELRRAVRGGAPDEGLLASATWRRRRRVTHLLKLAGYVESGSGGRLYLFEPDLPGAVAIRPTKGTGWRLVALTGFSRGDVGVRVRSRIELPVDGRNFRQEFGLQVDWKG